MPSHWNVGKQGGGKILSLYFSLYLLSLKEKRNMGKCWYKECPLAHVVGVFSSGVCLQQSRRSYLRKAHPAWPHPTILSSFHHFPSCLPSMQQWPVGGEGPAYSCLSPSLLLLEFLNPPFLNDLLLPVLADSRRLEGKVGCLG